MRAVILLCGLFVTQPGCAHDLAHASAGATGCAPDEMTVSERALSWSTTSWRVQCRGLAFRCAGEVAPVCTVEPDASPRPAPAASAFEPPIGAAIDPVVDSHHSSEQVDRSDANTAGSDAGVLAWR